MSTTQSSRPARAVLHIRSSAGLYGAEQVVLNLCRSQQGAGSRVHLASLVSADSSSLALHEAAAFLGKNRQVLQCLGAIDLRAVCELRALFRRMKPEIVHTHDYKSAIYAFIAGLGFGLKRVATIHGWTERSARLRLYSTLERFVLRGYARVICVDRNSRDRLLALGFEPERVKVVPNGIDIARYAVERPAIRPVGPFIFAAIGRLSEEKAPDDFIRAIVALRDRGHAVKGMLYGDGPMRSGLEALVASLAAEECVVLAGNSNSIPQVLGGIDGLVLASKTEGMPMVALEAMAAGVPVVATDVGAIPELLGNGCGVVVPRGDTAALIVAMSDLVEGRIDAEAMVSAARTKLESACSRERQAGLIDAVYVEAAEPA